MKRRLIVLEVAGLSPHTLEQYIQAGELPNLARLERESEAWAVTGDAHDPMRAWATLHSGTDADDAPRIWDRLSEQGATSFVCGSMNASVRPGFRGLLLPDPWAIELAASSPELSGYLDFVRGHIGDRRAIAPLEYAKFGAYMITHGLSSESLIGLGLQLAEERRDAETRWKRAAALDLLQFDVFKHFWNKTHADFGTFFARSTTKHPSPDATLYGYVRLDALVGRFVDLARSDTTLALTTIPTPTEPGTLWLWPQPPQPHDPIPLTQIAPKLLQTGDRLYETK